MGALTTDRTRNSTPPIWFPLSHADAITTIDGIELVAVCDASLAQAEKVAQAYPGSMPFTDHMEMLRAAKPDIVGIATRTAGRCEIIADCAQHGVLAIHSEKPMARSMAEANVALDAMRKHNIGFTYGAVRRYMAPYLLAREVAVSGQIGEMRQIVIEHGSELLLWGHPHSVDLAMFFNPGHAVSSVRARLQIDPICVSGHTVDCDPLLNMAYLEFDNGVSAIISQASGYNVRLYGSAGIVSVIGNGLRVELRRNGTGKYESVCEELPFDTAVSGTRQAFLNLRAYLLENASTGISLEEVEAMHRVLFAIAWSELQSGRPVSPHHVPDDLFISGRFGDLYA